MFITQLKFPLRLIQYLKNSYILFSDNDACKIVENLKLNIIQYKKTFIV